MCTVHEKLPQLCPRAISHPPSLLIRRVPPMQSITLHYRLAVILCVVSFLVNVWSATWHRGPAGIARSPSPNEYCSINADTDKDVCEISEGRQPENADLKLILDLHSKSAVTFKEEGWTLMLSTPQFTVYSRPHPTDPLLMNYLAIAAVPDVSPRSVLLAFVNENNRKKWDVVSLLSSSVNASMF